MLGLKYVANKCGIQLERDMLFCFHSEVHLVKMHFYCPFIHLLKSIIYGCQEAETNPRFKHPQQHHTEATNIYKERVPSHTR